jgi:hypothetical protein
LLKQALVKKNKLVLPHKLEKAVRDGLNDIGRPTHPTNLKGWKPDGVESEDMCEHGMDSRTVLKIAEIHHGVKNLTGVKTSLTDFAP